MELSGIIYILILLGINYFDMKELKIPNLIVLPAILFGIYLTGNWHFALALFIIGASLFNMNRLCGGDLKLAVMVGAFMGGYSLPILLVAVILVLGVNRYLRFREPLMPFTPFVVMPSLFFIW